MITPRGYFAAVLAFLLRKVLALPTGAPSTACVSMYPQHPGPNGPASAQTSLQVPFQFQVASAGPGLSGFKITVMRNPNFPATPPPMMGFFLQVREPGTDQPLGEFVNLPNYARLGDCGGANTVTHTNNLPKPVDGGLEFFWNPTNVPVNVRNVQVLGTFVQSMQIFWVKVSSQIFAINSDDQAQPAGNVPPGEAVGLTSFPVTDASATTSVHTNIHNNNVDIDTTSQTNDRKPGFTNVGGGPNNINMQTGPHAGAQQVFAGFATVFLAAVAVL